MSESFEKLFDLLLLLRKECNWDKEQTTFSLTQYTVEEAHEVEEVALQFEENNFKQLDERNKEQLVNDLLEELGDLLIQPLLHSIIANENGWFSIDDVINNVHEKLVRRHPHVFDKSLPQDIQSIAEQWEQIKSVEKNN